MASWNYVTRGTVGTEVQLGLKGTAPCGFRFASEVALADLVHVFGPTLATLDVNRQKCTGEKTVVRALLSTQARL
jgi:hypothetical protein